MNARGELKLVFPTKEYKEQVMDYLKEHFENGEFVLAGDGGLDEIKDFDKWLEKTIEDAKKKVDEEGRVPATLFLGVRKSDNKVIGTIQIRHKLNDFLYKYGGHIGDGVRPSERKKGYATEMIRLALEECKNLGIDRVLMTCDKTNIASAKSIMNNGGVLENEVVNDEGVIEQRYWITLKKKFANSVNKFPNVIEVEQKIKSINDSRFKGDIYLNNFKKTLSPYLLENGLCIQNTGYKWLEFYDYSSKIRLTAIYNEKDEIVEWYFDIARSIGKENGIPYEDDLYLDVVLGPNGKLVMLDEDELEDAFNRREITKEEYDEAYQITNNLIEKIKGKAEEMKRFTDKYLKEIL